MYKMYKMQKKSELSKVVPSSYMEQRPWGSFVVLDQDQGYKVKRLVVAPGGRLSLQYHNHRTEHWTIVAGRGLVTRNEETLLLGPNASVIIPVGVVHRLENPSKEPLVVIEVQYGDYLEEDDIIRISDDYNRNNMVN